MHSLNAYRINNQPDLASYLTQIAECPDLTVILSLDGNYLDSALDMYSALNIWGITEAEYNLGGKWVFENGNRIFYMDNESAEVYVQDLSKTDTLRIRNIDPSNADKETVLDQLQINNISYGSCFSGVSILVYDNFTGEIISQKGFF